MESVDLSLIKNRESLPDWSGMNPDLLLEIAVRVPLVEDFMAFRGVCNSWRAAACKKMFKPSTPRVPLLMLPEKEDSDDREFFSLSKKKVCMRLSLPQLKGRKCVEVRFGWLLTLASSGEISLLNPLSGAQIEAPNYRSLPYSQPDDLTTDPIVDMDLFTRRAVLSANPSDTSNFALMVLLDAPRGLVTWRAGGKSWMEIKPFQHFDDIICYNDKFYGVRSSSYFDDIEVWVWDPSGSDLLASLVMEVCVPYDVRLWLPAVLYMVESSDGKLHVIVRHDEGGSFWRIGVVMVDVLKGRWELLAGDLDDDVVFLGRNAPVSVAASAFPGVVKPNCIYFTDDGENSWRPNGCYAIMEMGIYDFGSGDVFEFLAGVIECTSSISGRESLWIAPSS